MTINKSLLFTHLLVFIVGIFFCKLFLEAKCQEVKTKTPVISVKNTTDTTNEKKEIKFTIPAKILKHNATVQTPGTLDASGSTPAPTIESYIACFDSVNKDFEAHVCFDSKTKLFSNRFIYPERIINNKIETNIENTTETMIKVLPDYLIGFGVKSLLKENTIKTLPYLSFTANRKLWFLIASIELKALTKLNEGALKMEPELEGKIYVPL